jgi:antitoxin HicB
LNDYMKMSYCTEIVEDTDEDGFVVSYPDLPRCVTCDEIIENAVNAKKVWIETALEEEIPLCEPDSLDDYSRQLKLRIL